MNTVALPLLGRGKVRDIYEFDERHLVFVASNRVSAFDVILPTPIPNKGATLNTLTRFWMKRFESLCGNHIACAEHAEFVKEFAASLENTDPGQVEVVKKAEMLQVECVVRGFITGSGWKDYKKTGAVCGHKLPEGLEHCAQFPEPLFTPATKAATGHDENIDFARMCDIVGVEMGTKLRDLSIEIYSSGRDYAKTQGILIADTKFEFGIIDGEICLCDEVLTPDSSRFWPADDYAPGRDQKSFDKQIVRNYLETLDWDKTPPGPELPNDIVKKTAAAYEEIARKLMQ